MILSPQIPGLFIILRICPGVKRFPPVFPAKASGPRRARM